ncbi:glycosyl hydrolases family 38 protein [Stylonychia lemnae]|uniref:Glycosyl hydrolases family 38 protein n=1 Tax=Stylonychia lemnae TaxID=5949 RepID=A0A078B5B9_STYLE|nr:glycosyl hydrolases family 38 protein [Stylonychia lemnae]|eukprot:CDW88482.1 glycosyl hydrolases family 38 protein [Stylonychia lemnae]
MIPHSHQDPGWLNTPQGYYTQMNGGWVASDEACPLYFDLLQNIKRGHDFLNKTFGVIPKMAWHADSFGHSSQTAKLFKELGFEGLFLGRMNDQYRDNMISTKNMAFIWNPTFEGLDSEYRAHDGIYTHITHNMYHPPCDIGIGSSILVQSYDLYEFIRSNLKVDGEIKIIQCIEEFAQGYKTQNIMMMFGDDFAFSDAGTTFDFLDKFTQKINQVTTRYTFKYSTFSKYLKDLKEELKFRKLKLNPYYGDFMPLKMAHFEHYWNGYYTSRPNLKYSISRGDSKDQQLIRLSKALQEEWALLMHHDTITGTSVEFVMRQHLDEIKLLNQMNEYFLSNRHIAGNIFPAMFQDIKLIYHQSNDDIGNLLLFGFQNFTYVILHNPSCFSQFNPRLRVENVYLKYNVRVWDWAIQQFIEVKIDVLNQKNFDQSNYADLFIYKEILPFSHEIFEITLAHQPLRQLEIFEYEQKAHNTYLQHHDESGDLIDDETLIQETSENSFNFDGLDIEQTQKKSIQDEIPKSIGFKDTCLLEIEGANMREIDFRLNDLVLNMTIRFKFELRYYPSYDGYRDSGGIYIFKTKQSDSSYFSDSLHSSEKQDGEYQSSIQFRYKSVSKNTFSIVTVFLTKNEDGCGDIEFDVKKEGLEFNVEATVNWSTDQINNTGIFYTDSNGLEYVKRIRKHALEEQDIKSTAPANFYPVNTGIFIESQNKTLQMIVMNDRSQAGSGFRDGRIELLFNRRVFTNDNLGNPEFLNEINERGEPIRTHNKYFIRFTQQRNQAFKAITERTMKTLNPVRMFQASRFFQENVNKTLIEKEMVFIPKLHSILMQLDIVDYKLIPDPQYETLILWLQQFNPDKNNVKKINREQVSHILKQLCKIIETNDHFAQQISKCDENQNFEFTKPTGQAFQEIEEHKNEYSMYKIITVKIFLK